MPWIPEVMPPQTIGDLVREELDEPQATLFLKRITRSAIRAGAVPRKRTRLVSYHRADDVTKAALEAWRGEIGNLADWPTMGPVRWDAVAIARGDKTADELYFVWRYLKTRLEAAGVDGGPCAAIWSRFWTRHAAADPDLWWLAAERLVARAQTGSTALELLQLIRDGCDRCLERST